MTYSGLFDEGKEVKKLKEKIKDLKIKVKNLEGWEEIHRKNNGDLRIHITKLENEIFLLKKDNKILEEGNEALGINPKK